MIKGDAIQFAEGIWLIAPAWQQRDANAVVPDGESNIGVSLSVSV
jgi:hypothetical protein